MINNTSVPRIPLYNIRETYNDIQLTTHALRFYDIIWFIKKEYIGIIDFETLNVKEPNFKLINEYTHSQLKSICDEYKIYLSSMFDLINTYNGTN